MKTAESRLAQNPIYHAIGIADDIRARFNWITTILGTTERNSVQYPILRVSRLRAHEIQGITTIAEQQIGLIFIQDDGIHFRGLTDFQGTHFNQYTTVLLESPRMDEEVCDAVCQMIHHANHHDLMRNVMVSPMEKAGVGPGLDDD